MGEILDVAFGGAAATLDTRRRPWVLGVAHLTGVPGDQAPFDVDTIRSLLDVASSTVHFPSGPLDFVPGGYERRLNDLYELVTFASEAAPQLELKIGFGAAGFVAVAFTRSDVFDDNVTRPGGVLLTDAESVVADTYILAVTSALELGYDGGIDFIFDVVYDRTDPPLTVHALDEHTGQVVPVTSSRAVSEPVYGHAEYSRERTTPRSAHQDIHRLASDLVGLFGRTPQFVEMLPPQSEDYQGDPLKAKERD